MQTLLVANRGEIALRIVRAAQELGIRSVAVCSEVDVDSLHVEHADSHVVIGPASATKSYLNVDALLAAAEEAGADSVHPGYGFLSENAEFAQRVIDAGLTWVGPAPEAIRQMGDKAAARAAAERADVPTVPGSDGPVSGLDEAREVAETVGYPLAIKASAGGGGRGIRIVANPEELAAQVPVAQAEAKAAFGSGEVYLERFVARAKHIEVQVIGDGTRAIHFGERECSLQRRRQKVIEEAPAPGLPDSVREELTASAVRLAERVGYSGAGTVEYLYDPAIQEFFFIEMNTRIQVEHPVTEMITGHDLVKEQLLIAAGNALSITQDDVQFTGHSIEARLNAENPDFDFLPSPGHLDVFRMPGGPFVRVDSGFEAGRGVPPFYDSMLAKIIVWGRDRDEALSRLARALDEVEVQGIATTVAFKRRLLDLPEVRSGDYHTTYLEDMLRAEGSSDKEAT
ncbi:acetyl-CoA carboxylase biotin carboxylase subunit [Nostocoides sp. F2B08]|nr:acetyl-CoA carboxylase biotin carboxylase subunit [Tetrasphaera sp. F2B08]